MKTKKYKKMFKLIIIGMMVLVVTIFVDSVGAAGRGSSANTAARAARAAPAAQARVQTPPVKAAVPRIESRSSPAASSRMEVRSQPMRSTPNMSSRIVTSNVSQTRTMPSVSQRVTVTPGITATPSTTVRSQPQTQTFRVQSNPSITVRSSNRSTIVQSRSAAPVVKSETSKITIDEKKIGAPISVNRSQSNIVSVISKGNENSKANVVEKSQSSRAAIPTVTVKTEKESKIGTVIGENKPTVSVPQTSRASVVREIAAVKQTPSVIEKSASQTSRAAVEKEKISGIGQVIGKQPTKDTAPAGQEKNKQQLITRIDINRRNVTERTIINKTQVTEMPAIGERQGQLSRDSNVRQPEVEKNLKDKAPLTEMPTVREREGLLNRNEKALKEKMPVTKMPEVKDRQELINRKDNRQVGGEKSLIEKTPLTQMPGVRNREGLVNRPDTRSGEMIERAIENKTPLAGTPAVKDRGELKGIEVFREGDRTIRSEPVRVAPDEERELSKRIVARHPEMRHGRENDRIMYCDRTDWRRHHDRTRFIFIGYNSSFCYRPIWPGYYYWVNYSFGRYSSFCYVRPYYHRRYVFVSLGGWWPYHYSYVRYYWYGWHPYYWYGYYPVAYQIPYDTTDYYTYNYYTYNYYNTDTAYQTGTVTELPAVNQYTFADVRERMAQQAAQEPAPETLADKLFDEGVNAFDLNSFSVAADKFAQAIQLAPDDMILPFAYAQSLFAMGNYADAAEALREALKNIKPEQEGVFYPRGLYHEDKILLDQIEELAGKAKLYSFDADLQLLLGYQLLGIGETDEALEHLLLASRDMTNAPSAQILLEVQRKIKEGQNEQTSNNIQTGKAQPSLEYMPAMGLAGGTEQWQSNIGTNWRYAACLFVAWQPQMLLAVGKSSRYLL